MKNYSTQIFPPSLNKSNTIFDVSLIFGEEIVAFGSENIICIFHEDHVIQILSGHENPILSVKWCKGPPKLMGLSNGKIVLYRFQKQKHDPFHSAPSNQDFFRWNLSHTIECSPKDDGELICGEWNLFGNEFLICTTKKIKIFHKKNKKWFLKWEYNSPYPVSSIDYSPDDRMFYTLTPNNCLLKIFFMNHNKIYENIYIPHPRGLQTASWRPQEMSIFSKTFKSNCIMTYAHDNVIRIWTETHKDEELRFNLSFLIDVKCNATVFWLSSIHELAYNEVVVNSIKRKNSRINVYDAGHTYYKNNNDVDNTKEKISLKESNSLISVIDKNGTFSLYLIQGLGDFPRRTAKSGIRVKLPNIFHHIQNNFDQCLMYYKENINTSIITPSEITMYVKSKRGKLSLYKLSINNKKSKETNLELMEVLSGHSGNIKRIFQHPTLPLIASIDRDTKRTVIWHVRDSNYFNPKDILTNLFEINFDSYGIAWLSSDHSLIVSNNDGIHLYHVYAEEKFSQYNTLDYLSPFPSCYSFKKIDGIEFESSYLYAESKRIQSILVKQEVKGKVIEFTNYVFALSSNGKAIGVWEVVELLYNLNKREFKVNLLHFKEFNNAIKCFDVHALSLEKGKNVVKKEENDVKKEENDEFGVRLMVVVGEKGKPRQIVYVVSKKKDEKVKRRGGLLSRMSKRDGKLDFKEWMVINNEDNNAVIKGMVLGKDNSSRLCVWYKRKNYVNVYEMDSSNVFVLEEQIEFMKNETIHGADFFSVSNGKYSLSIGTSVGVYCYSQEGYMNESNKIWKKIAFYDAKFGCKDVIATKYLTVIGTDGKMIKCYAEWNANSSKKGSELSLLHRRLPDYHPTMMEDLLMFGKFENVKRIFIHLASSLRGIKDERNDINIPYLPVDHLIDITDDKKDVTKEIKDKNNNIKKKYNFLQTGTSINHNDGAMEEDEFEECYKLLKDKLSSIALPQLSRLEQMKLMAILETVDQIKNKPGALDDSSIRYLVAFTIMKGLSRTSGGISGGSDLKSSHLAWALHSETQETLISLLNVPKRGLTWTFLKKTGVIYWLKNPKTFRDIFQDLGKCQFSKRNQPADCALIYLALKKKSTLIALFKACDKKRVAKLFARDFTQHKAQIAACKNAYSLLGRHDYHYAAAFYLLGNRIDDALDIIVNKIEDVHLAFLITRLYYGIDHEETKKVLKKIIIPYARKRYDVWLESIAYWLCKEYKDAILCLVNKVDSSNINSDKGVMKSPDIHFDQSVFEYCLKLSLLPINEISKLNVFMKKEKTLLLLRVSYFLYKSGIPSLALESVRRINEIKDDSIVEKGKKQNEQIESGMVDFSMVDDSFGFGGGGGGGGGGGFGMGNDFPGSSFGFPNDNYNVNTSSSNSSGGNESDESEKNEFEKENVIVIKKRKLLLCFYSMLQILHNVSECCVINSTGSNVSDEWMKSVKVVQESLDFFQSRYEIERKDVVKKLNSYCKKHSLLVGNCLLNWNNVKKIIRMLKSICVQIISIIPLQIQNKLSASKLMFIERLYDEYFCCCIHIENSKKMTYTERSEIILLLYVLKFLIAWSKRDFLTIMYLFSCHKEAHGGGKKKNVKRNVGEKIFKKEKFSQFLLNSPKEFFNILHILIYEKTKDIQIEKELEEEELKFKKKQKFNNSDFLSTTSNSTGGGMRKSKSYSNIELFNDLRSEMLGDLAPLKVKRDENDVNKDEIKAKILENDFNWGFFNALIVSRLRYMVSQYITYVCDNSKERKSAIFNTLFLKLESWCEYLEKKLHLKKIIIMSTNNSYEIPNFKEIVPPSFNNPFNKLIFTKRSYRRKYKNVGERQNSFTSFMHILEQQQTIKTNKYNLFKSFIVDVDRIETFKSASNEMAIFLWKYLTKKMSKFSPKKSKKIEPLKKDVNGQIVSFSKSIEIVRAREKIKSFCVNTANPNFLAFSTNKLIREVNIDHSIKYRKRNKELDKLLDDEANTWEGSLNRFNHFEKKFNDDVSQNLRSVELCSNIDVMNFVSNVNYFDGSGKSVVEKRPNIEKKKVPKSSIIGKKKKKIDITGISSRDLEKNKKHYQSRIRKRIELQGTPSFMKEGSLLFTSFRKKKKKNSKKKKKKIVTRNKINCNVLTSHPFLPFYLSGGIDGSIRLWQFGLPNSLRTYKRRTLNEHDITSIKFSKFGYKFGATIEEGTICLWRFDPNKESKLPFDQFKCHETRANDFTFLNSSSLIATVGCSGYVRTMRLWDLLLPEESSCIATEFFEDEPFTINYSAKNGLLVVGCKKGNIHIFNVKEKKVVKKIQLEDRNVNTIEIDIAEEFFTVGCSDGDVSIYDLKGRFKQLKSFKNLQGASVTDSKIISSFYLSSGSDGRVLRRTIL